MSENNLDTFETNGYLVIKNALPTHELDTINEALDRDFRERRDTFYSRVDGRTLQSVRVMEVETAFDTLITHGSTFHILKTLMQDDIAFSELSVIIKEPETGTHAAWHKDIGYKGIPLTRSLLLISCIYYLTDVPPQGACFSVVPGSHKRDEPLPKVEHLEDMPGQVKLSGKAGTAIIFNANLWHAAMPNQSHITRKTVHIYYCRPWMKPSGHTHFPERLLVDAETDFMKRFYHANWGAAK